MADTNRLTRTACDRDAGKVDEGGQVGADHLPLPGSCRRSDDEVVGATWRTRPPDMRQQGGVRFGNVKVVGLDRDGVENGSDEPLTFIPPTSLRQPNANLQLRHGDRRHRDIISVVEHIGEGIASALGIDQGRRVKD